jgi:hypothetical protein
MLCQGIATPKAGPGHAVHECCTSCSCFSVSHISCVVLLFVVFTVVFVLMVLQTFSLYVSFIAIVFLADSYVFSCLSVRNHLENTLFHPLPSRSLQHRMMRAGEADVR